jgi:DNA-directed RNA polymerase specialized sigma24 family protein
VVADRAGFEGFYRENLARVVRACALVLADRSAAEEVAAEAFTRLWSHWGAIGGDDHAGGYVFKTAMRLCRKRATRSHRDATARRPNVPARTSWRARAPGERCSPR